MNKSTFKLRFTDAARAHIGEPITERSFTLPAGYIPLVGDEYITEINGAMHELVITRRRLTCRADGSTTLEIFIDLPTPP